MRARSILAGVLAVTSGVGVARAQDEVPRAVVLRFAGPRAEVAREAVMVEIASWVELVHEDQAVATAEAMGVDVSTPEGMAQVVREMGISLVVAGSVEGRRGPTRIVVVDPDGEELASRQAPNPGRDVRAIGPVAVEAIQAAQAELRRREAEARADAAFPAASPAVSRDSAADPATRPASAPGAEPPRASAAEPPPDVAAPREGWRQPLVQLLGGVRLRGQTVDALGPDGEGPFFATDAYPELDLEVVARPFAGAPDLARGLYLAAAGAFSVGARYVGERGEARDMQSYRLRVDAGFGFSGDIFEVVGMLGVGVNGVSLAQDDGFRSYTLSWLRPGALVRVQAAGELLLVEVGAGARVGLTADELAEAYGPGLAFGGLDLSLGAGGVVEGFTYAARFVYGYVALGYGEGGGLSDAASGVEESFEGRLLVCYSFR